MLPAAQREHAYAPSFFHLIDGTDLVLDLTGSRWPPKRRLDLRYRIDVHNDAGARVHSLTFEDALEIVPPPRWRQSWAHMDGKLHS